MQSLRRQREVWHLRLAPAGRKDGRSEAAGGKKPATSVTEPARANPAREADTSRTPRRQPGRETGLRRQFQRIRLGSRSLFLCFLFRNTSLLRSLKTLAGGAIGFRVLIRLGVFRLLAMGCRLAYASAAGDVTLAHFLSRRRPSLRTSHLPESGRCRGDFRARQ